MSHELEQFSNGSTAFVAGHNKDAWHQLGTVLPEGLTADQVMEHGLLGGWNVRKEQVFTRTTDVTRDGANEQVVPVPGKFVTLRTNPVSKTEEIIGGDSFNGIVGESYEPFPNESLTEYLQTIVDESGAIFDTAGSMRGGADVFVTMKMPETMLIGGVDPVDLYLAVLNNHTGNRAITGLITPVRIVCANTQSAALANARSSFKIRHTENAGARVQEAREELGLTFKFAAEFQAEADKMIQQSLDEAAFRKFCDQIWKPRAEPATDRSKTLAANRRIALNELFLEAESNDNIRGTRWAGYQAIADYLDHASPVNGMSPGDKATNRALRTIDGSAVNLKEKAFAVLSE